MIEDADSAAGLVLDRQIRHIALTRLFVRTKRQGAQMMIDVIEKFRTSRVQALPNRKDEATYFTFPTRADVREFRKRGHRLLL